MGFYPFGDRLRALREQRGMKRSELADMLGVSEPKIGHLETGQRGVSIADALKLAKIFDMTLDELVPTNENGEFVARDKEPA